MVGKCLQIDSRHFLIVVDHGRAGSRTAGLAGIGPQLAEAVAKRAALACDIGTHIIGTVRRDLFPFNKMSYNWPRTVGPKKRQISMYYLSQEQLLSVVISHFITV